MSRANVRVRPATHDDAPEIAALVRSVDVTSAGLAVRKPVDGTAIGLAERIDAVLDEDSRVLLVACDDAGEIVGMLAASWQLAIHVPGRYATIQDLWVHAAWRGRSIGADLMTALVELARERGMARIEVGLPRESFRAIDATEAFYRNNGFEPLGSRMRRLIE